MAADVKAGCSKDAKSDESQEYKCSVCFKRGERTEATHYCPSCDVCYCKSCVCNHSVMGKFDIQQWGSSKRRKTEDMCAWHPQEALLLLCKSHDELCCRLCLSGKHRFCTDTLELQSIKDETATQEYTQNILQMLDKLKKRTDVFIEDRNLRCKTVETSYNACQKRLGEFRQKVITKFDEIELELSKHKVSYLDRYKGDQNVCQNALTALEEYQQRFGKTTQQYNAYELKKCTNWMSYTDNYLEMNMIVIKDSFVPIALTDIESTVETINKLGTINMDHDSFGTKIDGDADTCEIVGMCQMPDGSIIVADSANKKLKKFDPAFTYAGHCEFKSTPRDVCCVNDTEVAVTNDNQQITFVSISDTLDITRSISTSFNTYTVVSLNLKLYLPNQTGRKIVLYTYNMRDEKIQSIEIPNTSLNQYTCRLPIACSKTGLRMYIGLSKGRLISYDDKRVIETNTEQFDYPLGVCVDDRDFVYVSDSSSNEVRKLDSKTNKNTVWSTSIPITTEKQYFDGHGIPILSPSFTQTPQSTLCFDSHHGRVLVASKKGDSTVFII